MLNIFLLSEIQEEKKITKTVLTSSNVINFLGKQNKALFGALFFAVYFTLSPPIIFLSLRLKIRFYQNKWNTIS